MPLSDYVDPFYDENEQDPALLVDYDPINPTPIMLMAVGSEPPQPVCRTLGCPHSGGHGCIYQGFCDDDFMLWHERPHIWQGDYS